MDLAGQLSWDAGAPTVTDAAMDEDFWEQVLCGGEMGNVCDYLRQEREKEGEVC